MRRTELLSAVKNVHTALRKSGFAELISQHRRPREKSDEKEGPQIISFLINFRVISETFQDNEKKICAILKLDQLFDDSALTQILMEHLPPEVLLRAVIPEGIYAIQQLSMMIELLETDAIRLRESMGGEEAEEEAGNELLTIVVIENSDEKTDPDRLIKILKGTKDLYDVFAKLENEESSEIVVVGCDSGSDKSFDFYGARNVIKGMKSTIVETFLRLSLLKELQTRERLKIVAESVGVLGRIEEGRENGNISPEDAQRLSRKVVTAVMNLIESHIVIPEIEDEARIAPREILAPPPKAIVDRTGESSDQGHDAKIDSSDSSGDKDLKSAEEFLGKLTSAQREKLFQQEQERKNGKRRKRKK